MNRLPQEFQHKSLAGNLLVASPDIQVSPFDRSVILILQHGSEGAHGTILNKPLGASIGSLWEKLGGETINLDEPVHMGGPASGPLFALHQQKQLAEMTTANDVYLSATKEHLEQLVSGHVTERDSPLHLYVGHVKWEAKQLDKEIDQGMWYQLPATADMIFGEHSDLWFEALRAVGRQYWADTIGAKHIPPDPSLN